MRTPLITCLLIVPLTFSFFQPLLADETLTPDVILARSKPAIFKILAGAEVDTDYPKVKLRVEPDPACGWSFSPLRCLSRPSILHLDYESDWAAHRTDYSELIYAWVKIASDPARYLDVDDTLFLGNRFSVPCHESCRHLEHQDLAYATGSGFAVSQEGILLTNAHVVLPPNADELKKYFLVLPVQQAFAEFQEQLGGAPPQDNKFLESLGNALAGWLQTKGTITLKRAQVRVVMTSSAMRHFYFSDISDILLAPSELLSRKTDGWKTYSVPAEIVTSGAPGTASDVAVLRLEMPNILGEKLWRQAIPRLLCLPLGDSDEVHNPIHAMGFPGRVSNALRENPAVPQVIVHPGEASAVVGGGGSLLHMSATISEGDSGGPVVDSSGEVVGLNVARVTEAEGDSFAIPINTAKKFLAAKGIKPFIGPASIHWFAAQEAFDQQQYSSAYRELEGITDPADPKLRPLNQSDADGAISELALACEKRIKEGRDKSGLLDKAWYKWKY